jgi:hypothetical protein
LQNYCGAYFFCLRGLWKLRILFDAKA